jgi:ribose transport system permease protein
MNAEVEAPAAARPLLRARPRRFLVRDYGILAILVALFVALSISSSSFLSKANLVSVLDQSAVPGIAACGVTLAIVSGAFDLSLGSVYAVAGIVAIKLAASAGTPLAYLAALAAGLALGLVNGIIIGGIGVNSFIATLATSFGITGLALLLTDGLSVSTSAAHFGMLGSLQTEAGITPASWVFIGVILVAATLLHFTGYGRAIYAIGGNREAARLAGLRVRLDQIIVLGMSGGCAAIAGLVDASRASAASSQSGAAPTLALTAIAATVIGGTSIAGGEGGIWRAVVGVLILGFMADAFTLLNVNGNYQDVVECALILIAVGIDVLLRRRA